jgi:acetate kinase
VDDAVLERLERLVPLAPLHQPNNLATIREIRARRPEMPQVACFDTAFHRGHPEVADRFAIADSWYREGVRRYGFHGLSYAYIADRLREVDPDLAQGRVVVCHLGSGASMCAIHAGRSLDSTMGFTAVDGLPMGTRTGQLDPGVVLYLLQAKGFDAARIQRFLYHDGGLQGLSGVSNDVRDLLASAEPGAALALDYLVYRIVREAGALAATMEGVDGIVFTAGIGEHSPDIRRRVIERLGWLGVELDPGANARHGPLISTAASRLKAYVVPTDEERMIARHSLALLGATWS